MSEEADPDGHTLFTEKQIQMEKKYTVTLRLSYQQYVWLGVRFADGVSRLKAK